MTLREFDYATVEAAASALARRLVQIIRTSIAEDGNAVLAVSGGRTPRFVFEQLRESDISWSDVIVTLTDERWVANDHSESNERLVREYLLKGRAEGATFIPLYGGESSVEIGLQCLQVAVDLLSETDLISPLAQAP